MVSASLQPIVLPLILRRAEQVSASQSLSRMLRRDLVRCHFARQPDPPRR
jgi:hypothetical protein